MSPTALLPTRRPSGDPDRADRASMRLVRAVQALSLARSLEAVVAVVRSAARELADADGASFILRDAENCYYVDEDALSPLWKGQRFPMTACVSGWVMQNRQPAVIKDIYEDPRIPYEAYRPTFVKSLVVVPIRSTDPVGAIGIYWAERHMASDFEVELLEALANTAAVAMENVQLYAEMEQRVRDRTRQLEEANRELEAFSYSVSHDLQAPLRHIGVYSSLLAEDHLAALDENGRGYLERIQTSAARMGGLISDLLRLARFARAELQPVRVDLSRLARDITDKLREDEPRRRVEFEIEPGVEARGDAALLGIVMENLLGNAWKFSAKREEAVIAFGTARQEDGTTAYFVRDNGAGFDMNHAHQLFGPFQRLHRQDEFGGSGIGLATVARIVHRHGGRIWAEAALFHHATFFFTLGDCPAAAPERKTDAPGAPIRAT